jgi:hypothetical protein
MPRVGFEPTIPAFERTITVHAINGAATVIGSCGSVSDLYIRKVLGSNLGRNTDYLTGATRGTPQSVQAKAGIVPQITS